MTYQFKVGDGQSFTPANGSYICNLETLKGENYRITKNGFGDMLEGEQWSRYYTGGFILLNGSQFTSGEIYTIIVED